MLGRTDSRFRALLLLVAFVVAAGSLGVRLAYWQVMRREELSALATRQSSMRYGIPSDRGSIYDRTGTVTLATSVSRDRLAANPKLLEPVRRAQVAASLVDVLGLEGEAADLLVARMTSDREYVVLEDGFAGQNLTLTIDASLQVAVEEELLHAWIADQAKRVSAVVMDPYSGEVYAYASYPSYDANQYQAIAAQDPGVFIDPIVSTVYEPG